MMSTPCRAHVVDEAMRLMKARRARFLYGLMRRAREIQHSRAALVSVQAGGRSCCRYGKRRTRTSADNAIAKPNAVTICFVCRIIRAFVFLWQGLVSNFGIIFKSYRYC